MHIDDRVKKSVELYERAGELIPGWTQLISRRSSQFAAGVSPAYAREAKGSRFIDVDGNEYIDWVNCVGAVILGHADDVVDGAVKEQDRPGQHLLAEQPPGDRSWRSCWWTRSPAPRWSATPRAAATRAPWAVRIARGVTGRDKVLFSGYHGWHDWYQSANYLVDPESGDFPFAGIEPTGVPKVLAGTAIPFVYGDLDMLEGLFEENKGEVGAVMMEPLRSDIPEEGYLEGVKELAHANGAVLIFDEVSCGWRTRIGGIQEFLGVTPDMSVFAKAMSNGYPMGVTVGSREVMEPAGQMFISSSYWSDNVGLAASLSTIRELRRRESETRLAEIGENMRAAISEAIDSSGIAAKCTGWHYRAAITFDLPDESLLPKVNTLFVQEMARRGVHCHASFNPTLAHTEEDIRRTAEAAEETFRIIQRGLEGELDELLVADEKKEPFRRLVR